MNLLTITITLAIVICILAVFQLIYAVKSYRLSLKIGKILSDIDNRTFYLKLDIQQIINRQESDSKMVQEICRKSNQKPEEPKQKEGNISKDFLDFFFKNIIGK